MSPRRSTAQSRLKAARIGAGYVTSRLGAEVIGFNASSFASVEAERRKAPADMLTAAAVPFGVTPDFLVRGVLVSVGDLRARRIEDLLQVSEYHGEQRKNWAARLRTARLGANFSSTRAAADHYGWPVSTYSGYESGTLPISIERLVIYVLSFGWSPEYAVKGVAVTQETEWMEEIAQRTGFNAPAIYPVGLRTELFEFTDGRVSGAPSASIELSLDMFPAWKHYQQNWGRIENIAVKNDHDLVGLVVRQRGGAIASIVVADIALPQSERLSTAVVVDGSSVHLVDFGDRYLGTLPRRLPRFRDRQKSIDDLRAPMVVGTYVGKVVIESF